MPGPAHDKILLEDKIRSLQTELAIERDARDEEHGNAFRINMLLTESKATAKGYLAEIKELHDGYVVTKDCLDCDGKGTREETVQCDYPSMSDPMTPAEEAVVVTCDRCHGSKKEWLT